MTVTGQARVAGVLGWPVRHSKSPQIHGFWLARHGLDGAYVPLPVAPADLAAGVAGLMRVGFAGANVTAPHKEAVAALCTHLDSHAERLGAVNTLVFDQDGGQVMGRNTDGYGFYANLRQEAPSWRPEQGPAVVLGAGGAARAVVAALVDAGVPAIRLVNRTASRAETLAAALGDGRAEVWDWAYRGAALAEAGLVVNTTSLGMHGQAGLNLDLAALPSEAVVNDLVYTPLETELLAAARARGNPVVDGLGMLLHQARPGFAAWFGVEPSVDTALRAQVLGG